MILIRSNYTAYHVHTDLSLLDSCTDFKSYIDLAIEFGQTAIAFTEHGKPLQWVAKKMYCDEKGIKYLHGVECYLTRTISEKVRDNYHTVLIAKDYAGLLEINKAISVSTQDDGHFYFTNRISFEEFVKLSNHVITTSACLASPLWKLSQDDVWYERLVKRYDYLEIQPHSHPDQVAFNQRLAILSKRCGKPLIAGTDAHSLSSYKAECRQILMDSKKQSYGDEDAFDLTYKSYDELVEAFKKQDAIPERLWAAAIENTNVLANSVSDFELDTTLKYPKLYGSGEADREKMVETIERKLKYKLDNGIIPPEQEQGFRESMAEELRVFDKIEMTGYILCMSELVSWCWEHGIPVGPARGSVGGSRIAYVTDIIDLNPEQWHTVFSRFANEDRKEVGDIDVDIIDTDRPQIFKYLIDRFGQQYTARVPTWGTAAEAGAIELIFMGLRNRWHKKKFGAFPKAPADITKDNPYGVRECERTKKAFAANPDETRKGRDDVFYYYDGMLGTKVSQSVHAAGIVVSPITLADHYGVFWKDGELLLDIDMEEIHEVSLVKFDLLVLNNIGIIKDTCELANIKYPRSHEINWNDEAVWKDMMRSPVGIFQMEGEFAFKLLRDFKTQSIFDMSLVTACIRPSGASYRADLIKRKPNRNPSKLIDELLSENMGYLVYQEDVIKFLQEICGLSGSDADNVRRAIGRKDKERLQKALPAILDGYCTKSDQPHNIAEQEANTFLQIIDDASSYMFGYNHSVAYCLIGYICAWLRYYHPGEFITTYLNHAKNDSDVSGGTELAKEYKIKISPPKFGLSKAYYAFDVGQNVISKGLSSIKGYGAAVCTKLYETGRNDYRYFVDALADLYAASIKAAGVTPLISIDYFSRFGNSVELHRVLGIFDMFYDRKTMQKEKVAGTPLEDIIKKYASGLTAKGADAKSYTITDLNGLLRACEDYIKSLGLQDVDIKTKMANQKEILGYVDLVTNKEEDRRKLMVSDLFPLKNRDTGEIWAYAVNTRSLGSGKSSRLTIYADKYNARPFRENDIIYARRVEKNKKGYWYIYDYDYVV